MSKKYLTNLDRPAAAEGLCWQCYGWGFPIMFLGGREAYNMSASCPECGGTGKAPEAPVDLAKEGQL